MFKKDENGISGWNGDTHNGALKYPFFQENLAKGHKIKTTVGCATSGVSLAKETCKLWLLWFSSFF